MSIAALNAARTKLMADVPMNAFWQARYSRSARHLVGYKRAVSATDFPFASYSPVLSTRAKQVGGWHQERITDTLNHLDTRLEALNSVPDDLQAIADFPW